MTTISLQSSRVDALVQASAEAGLRAPSAVSHPVSLNVAQIDYTPDLSAAEQTTLTALLGLLLGATLVTPAERTALEADIATLRTFRQQTQAGFIALTQNQRDRLLFDAINAQTNVLRALLRDG